MLVVHCDCVSFSTALVAQMSQTDEITEIVQVGKNLCVPLNHCQLTSNSITDEDDKGVILNSLSMHDVGRRWPHVARKLSLKMNVIHDIRERSSSTTECYDQVVSVRNTRYRIMVITFPLSDHQAWLDGNIKETVRSQASWEELLNAIAAPDGGNNVALAVRLAKEKNCT